MELISLLITGVVSVLASSGVQLLFFRQTRRRMQVENQAGELDNKSKQAEEWRKLYEEELGENRKKDELIKNLYLQVDKARTSHGEVEIALAKERARNAHLSVLKCLHYDCADRRPPFEEVARKFERETKEDESNGTQQND